ncbi:hypothetical protein Btru_040160 [Bulinus truncatus]|nr:hypothetical protein Btru_040160 [Bulinus truncatus]
MKLHICSSVKDKLNRRTSSVTTGYPDRNKGDNFRRIDEGDKSEQFLRESDGKENKHKIEKKFFDRLDDLKVSRNSSDSEQLNDTQSLTQSVQNVSLTKVHPKSQKAGSEDGKKQPESDKVMTLDYETDMSSPDQTFPETSFPERPGEVVETEAYDKKSSLVYDYENITNDAEDRLDNDALAIHSTSEIKGSEASLRNITTKPNRQSKTTVKQINPQTKDILSPTKISAAETPSKNQTDILKSESGNRSQSGEIFTHKEPTATNTPVDPQSPSPSTNGSFCSTCNETSKELDSANRSSTTPITPRISENPTTSNKFHGAETPKPEYDKEPIETEDYDVTIFGGEDDEVSNKDCPTCGSSGLTEEDVKELRLNLFAGVLRQKLRLYNRDFSPVEEQTLPKLPEVVKEQTFKDDRVVEEKFEFYARDEEIIITGAEIGYECIKMNANSTGCYTFDLKGNRVKRGIDSAFLWFYKTKDRHDVHKHELLLYELGLRRRFSGRLKEKSILARSELYIKEGWVSMELTIPVRKWVEQGGDKKILAIKCNTCATKHYKALYGVKEGYKPVLVIKYLKPKNDRREKRNAATCDPRTECCKRPLVADFNMINLHHIIRPKNMSIGFCYGYCDSIDQFTYNHTALKQRVRWAHNEGSTLRDQLRSCCVPLVLKDAFIITTEEGAIVRKLLPNVIVEKCGCL